MTTDPKSKLKDLSRALSQVHKSLLHFQKEVYEDLHNTKLSPYDLLHLSVSNPEFDWLKQMSTIIVQVDEIIDDEEAISLEDFYTQTVLELKAMFIDQDKHPEFKKRIMNGLSRDPNIWMELAGLRKQLDIK